MGNCLGGAVVGIVGGQSSAPSAALMPFTEALPAASGAGTLGVKNLPLPLATPAGVKNFPLPLPPTGVDRGTGRLTD